MTHTPGKMKVLSGTYNGRAEVKVVPEDYNDSTYVLVGGWEKENRAHLFSAAPELLEACQESLKWISKLAADHDGDEIAVRAMKQHAKIEQAISKAEGR